MNKNRKIGVTSSETSSEETVTAVKPQPKPLSTINTRKVVPQNVDLELPEEEEEELSFTQKNSKLIIGCALILVVLILLIVMIVTLTKEPEPIELEQPSTTGAPVLSEEERIKQELEAAGIGKDYYESRNLQTKVESDSVFSLEGKDIPEMWEMKNTKSYAIINTLIPYTKHRAVTGIGIEIYWLEGIYNGSPCKFTIPYIHYKSLAESGSCAVKVEIVETSSGEKIATSFTFDYEAQVNLGKTKR